MKWKGLFDFQDKEKQRSAINLYMRSGKLLHIQ